MPSSEATLECEMPLAEKRFKMSTRMN